MTEAGLAARPLLEVGGLARLELVGPDGPQDLEVEVQHVQQRVWSRVGRGTAGDRAIFLKQFRFIDGSWGEALQRFECEGIQAAVEALGQLAEIPPLLGKDTQGLTLAYPDRELRSVDESLRQDPEAFWAELEPLLRSLLPVLNRLNEVAPDPEFIRKERSWGGPSPALCFKGIDIRNIALTARGARPDKPILFDLGRPYFGPPEENVARLFVSLGLLNWGRPLRRFASGPDVACLELGREVFGARLTHVAVMGILRSEASQRMSSIYSGSPLQGAMKWVGLRTVGRRYLAQLEDWCDRNLR